MCIRDRRGEEARKRGRRARRGGKDDESKRARKGGREGGKEERKEGGRRDEIEEARVKDMEEGQDRKSEPHPK